MDRALLPQGAAHAPVRPGRRKLWEISPAYHCVLIGSCLPVSVLRRLARRASLAQSSSPSDYELHHAAVHLAGRRCELSKLIHKEMEARYSPAVARLARADTECALVASWKTALESGELAGGLWALMTHPLASQRVQDLASQDMHMLSHQVGAASRADLHRLASLEQENRTLRERLEDQSCKGSRQLADKAAAIAGLKRRLAECAGTDLRLREAEQRLNALQEERTPLAHDEAGLPQRLARSEARCLRLERALAQLRLECDAAERTLHEMLSQRLHEDAGNAYGFELSGRRVLYVGGRTGLVEHYRLLVERHGGELLHHDGGLEENLKRLHPLLAAADVVVCAAGESSHGAYYLVKRYCKQAGKPCALLGRASLASLLNALRALAGASASISARDTLLHAAA